MKKVLVVGANSMIGQALVQGLPTQFFQVYGTTRQSKPLDAHQIYLDLLDLGSFDPMMDFDTIVFSAGLTKISACEEHPELSEQINYQAPVQFIRSIVARNPKVHIIFLSTTAVFNGHNPYYKITDVPEPVTVYGYHKYQAEKKIAELTNHFSIIRLTKVFNRDFALMSLWLSALERDECIYPYDDLYVCPVHLSQVVELIMAVIQRQRFGLIHLSGTEELTYYEFAKVLCKLKAMDISLVKASSMKHEKYSHIHASLCMQANADLIDQDKLSVVSVLNNLIL